MARCRSGATGKEKAGALSRCPLGLSPHAGRAGERQDPCQSLRLVSSPTYSQLPRQEVVSGENRSPKMEGWTLPRWRTVRATRTGFSERSPSVRASPSRARGPAPGRSPVSPTEHRGPGQAPGFCGAAAAVAAVVSRPSTPLGPGCASSWTDSGSARLRASRRPSHPLISLRPHDRRAHCRIGSTPSGPSTPAFPRRIGTGPGRCPCQAALPSRPLDHPDSARPRPARPLDSAATPAEHPAAGPWENKAKVGARRRASALEIPIPTTSLCSPVSLFQARKPAPTRPTSYAPPSPRLPRRNPRWTAVKVGPQRRP